MLRHILNFYQRQAALAMFSRWSPTYEQDVAENAYSAADHVAQAALKYLGRGEAPDPMIADIGIGTGLLARQIFEALPCRITGIDFTEDMMAVCLQKEVTELLLKLDAGRDLWPMPWETYQAVVSAGLIEYFTSDMLQHFVKESAKCLAPGGYLIFTYVPSTTGKNTVEKWHGRSGNFLSCRYDPDQLAAMIAKNGFTLLEHGEAFTGSVFRDGSTYPYRLIAARKN